MHNLLKSLLEEMSTNVGGANMSPGSGEQTASPVAFGKKKKKLTKEEKGVLSLGPGKRRELYSTYFKDFEKIEEQTKKYVQNFEFLGIKDMVDDEGSVKKFIKIGEALEEGLRKLNSGLWGIADDASEAEDNTDDSDEKRKYRKEYDACMALTNEITKVSNAVEAITEAIDKILDVITEYKESLNSK